VLFSCFLLAVDFCCGHAIKSQALESSPNFSPYYAAFSDKLKRDIREYDRLKEQLKHINPIDWDEIAKVKAFESTASD
jgi:hypothetical protein